MEENTESIDYKEYLLSQYYGNDVMKEILLKSFDTNCEKNVIITLSYEFYCNHLFL